MTYSGLVVVPPPTLGDPIGRSAALAKAGANLVNNFLVTCRERGVDPLRCINLVTVYHVPPGGAADDPLANKEMVGWKVDLPEAVPA